MARPTKDKDKVKSKNIKVTEDCHRRLKEYLYHQPDSWAKNELNEIGDVVETILNEWEGSNKPSFKIDADMDRFFEWSIESSRELTAEQKKQLIQQLREQLARDGQIERQILQQQQQANQAETKQQEQEVEAKKEE